jgi:hypothetical protein
VFAADRQDARLDSNIRDPALVYKVVDGLTTARGGSSRPGPISDQAGFAPPCHVFFSLMELNLLLMRPILIALACTVLGYAFNLAARVQCPAELS